MSEKIDLSICIVNYNVCNFLKICLESLYSYKLEKLAFEVIIVDNASKDDSAQMVRNEFPQARLTVLDRNAGFAAANNVALRQAKGDFLFLLNPDTKICEKSLHILVEYLTNNPECGIAGPRLLNEDGSIQNGLRRFPTCNVILFRNTPLKNLSYFKRRIDEYHMRNFDLKKSAYVDQVSGAAMMFSRNVFDKIGYLDERFYIYFEEVDFCRRAHDLGLKVRYVAEASIFHFGGKSAVQLNSKIKYIHMESQIKYLRKHMLFFKFCVFIVTFKIFYLTNLFFELLVDTVFLPFLKLFSLINPSIKDSRKYASRLNKSHYRYYFISNKIIQFLFL